MKLTIFVILSCLWTLSAQAECSHADLEEASVIYRMKVGESETATTSGRIDRDLVPLQSTEIIDCVKQKSSSDSEPDSTQIGPKECIARKILRKGESEEQVAAYMCEPQFTPRYVPKDRQCTVRGLYRPGPYNLCSTSVGTCSVHKPVEVGATCFFGEVKGYIIPH